MDHESGRRKRRGEPTQPGPEEAEQRLGEGRKILVSAPATFGDSSPRECRVISSEPFGLWLEVGDDVITEAVGFTDDTKGTTVILIPFAQMAYLAEPERFARLAQRTRAVQAFMVRAERFRAGLADTPPRTEEAKQRAAHKPPRKR